MRILDRSLELALSLLPQEYNNRVKYRTYHFSFIWRRNKLLATGVNGIDLSAKCAKMGRRFEVPYFEKYPYNHAEIDAISKLWGREFVDSSLSMVVLRLNKMRELMESKPCQYCSVVLSKLGLRKVWYSSKGTIITDRERND